MPSRSRQYCHRRQTLLYIPICVCVCVCVCMYFSCSVVSGSLWPHGLLPARLHCPWNSPGKILEWADIPFSRGSSWLGDWTRISPGLLHCSRFCTVWAARGFYSIVCVHHIFFSHSSSRLLLVVSASISLWLWFNFLDICPEVGSGSYSSCLFNFWGTSILFSRMVCLVTQSCLTLRPHGLQTARLLCPRDSPGKNTRVGCHALHQGIFPTQGLNSDLLCGRWLLDWLSHQGSPRILE